MGYQFNPSYSNGWGDPSRGGSPYYNNPNAPGVLPYMGGGNQYALPAIGSVPPAMINNPNAYYTNPAAGAYGSPVGNYYTEMEMLKRNIQMIQGGSAWNPNAPAVLPYPGPSLGTGFGNTPRAPSPLPMPRTR